MATLKPFRILRPNFEEAKEICTLPYDVMNTAEAREMAEGNPISFLRVTRSEIEFGDDASPYSDEVYQRGADNLRKLISEGHLIQEDAPCYMIYRLVMGSHTQTGLVAAASCDEYDKGIVKKHELTRPDKEDDRTRHINILGAQTGAVFLTYKAVPEIDALVASVTAGAPDIDYSAEGDIRHTAWMVRDAAKVAAIEAAIGKVPALYVADGHHRSAAASRVNKERGGTGPWNHFLTVTFPHDQMQILAYNRAVKDLNGLSVEQFLEKVKTVAEIGAVPADHKPTGKGECTMYLDGKWHLLTWKDAAIPKDDVVGTLDVAVLQKSLLTPFLNVGDPRTDKRISFVGGIRGTGELEKLVNSGQFAVAFAMYPTSIEDLMSIADADGLMPPKSTWFEPKLRDAMAVQVI